jgi:diguanylate cyclase (GGDEF)-like protein/PAS domain S-box-containing protein
MKRKMKVIVLHVLISFLLFSVILLSNTSYAAQQDNIVYKSATEYDYPPFSVVTNGEADGFSVELLKAVASEMGLTIEFKVDHWHVIKEELEEGTLDVLPLVGYSEEREEFFDFTVPYIVMRGNIFVRKDYTGIESEEDLYGKEIIVMRGDNSQEYAERNNFTDQLILVDTYAEAFELLSSGEHDAVLAQSLVGQKLINDLGISNIESVTRMGDNGVDRVKVSLEGYEQKFSFAVKEGDKELLAKLNEGLAIVSENGTYEDLYIKWFPFLIDTTPDYRMIAFYFIIALVIIIIGLLLFSFMMIKKEVRRKTAKLENNLYRNTIMFNVVNKEYDSVSDWLDYVLNEMIKMTDSQFGYIYLVNEEKGELILNSWSNDVMDECLITDRKTVYKLEKTGIWGEVVKQRRSMIINDFSEPNALKKGYPEGHVKLNNWMGVPVFQEGSIIATVGLANKSVDYDQNDIYQINSLMSGVWNMIERSKYRDKLEVEKNKYLSTLVSIGDAVMVIGLDEKIELINQVCSEMTGWSETEAKGVHYTEVFRLSKESPEHDIVDPVAAVLNSGKEHELSSHTILTSRDDTVYLLEDSASPIRNTQDQMIGVVLVFRDATQKQKQKKLIEYLSFHDVLTELYNRRFFEEEMKRLDTPRNYPLTIIMGDLNGLKLVNDAFGHYEGDKLLKQTADIFREYLRAEDIAARWGGDEFAILMPKTKSDDAEKVVQRITEAAQSLDRDKSILSIAFGWATKTKNTEDLEEIFKTAEEYMYKNKISKNQGVRGLTIKNIIHTLFDKSAVEELHSQKVKELSIGIAKALGLPQNTIDDISTMSLLHDIGKVTISREILEKPGRLNEEEYNEIKKHPATAYRMLSTTNEFSGIAEGILNHHERWDGKGYPNGVKGNDIPVESRIIAIAEAFDAMTSFRPYREKKLSLEKARQELIEGAGKQFDPEIVQLIIKGNILSEV